MKSLVDLWTVMANELAVTCRTSAARDINTVSRRFEHEGVSFLTITLPSFGKSLEQALSVGQVRDCHFPGFRKRGGTPAFLRGFLSLVFDQQSGCLLDEPSTDAIYAVRQLTLMCGKMLEPCSDARVRAAADEYVEIEKHLRSAVLSETLHEQGASLRRTALLLFGDVLARMDELAAEADWHPRHGPGATADRLRGNAKFDQVEWPTRLDEWFPVGDFLLPNWRFRSNLKRVKMLDPGAERPVRVTFVPKTALTPRVIAIEPTCMQYAQQAVMRALVPALEADPLVGPLIGFSDQTPNQRLAQIGSAYGGLATLDLSAASDRVSVQHVVELFRPYRNFLNAVLACRSTKADVPGHGVIPLAKFASMGSALCFPVEAMVFLTVAVHGIAEARGVPVTRKLLKQLAGSARVYGDDIVVPTHSAMNVVGALESSGFKVNASKSFWTGMFRESCGREYYAGTDVSIVRVRRPLSFRRSDASSVASAVSLRNQLYQAGLWRSAAWMDSRIVKRLGAFPPVHPSSPSLGRHSVLVDRFPVQRLCAHLQRPLVKAWVMASSPPPSPVSGMGALVKCLTKPGDEPFADVRHLTHYGRPESARIKLRWVSVS